MTAADIAEKYASKPGFRLADYMEVGLPVYHVILQVSTLLRKKIAPLDEFVMRCVKIGLGDCSEIASFLGLDRRIIESVVSGLIKDNDLALSGEQQTHVQALKLTIKGQKSLEMAETVVPEDRTIGLYFDALLREPAYYREQLHKAKDLRDLDLKEIPAIPAKQPKVVDFPLEEVQEILKNSVGTGEKRDLLAIKRVERCNRLFRRAVALLYKSIEGEEPYVEFVVDGKLTGAYGAAFTRADGLRLLGVDNSRVPEQELISSATGKNGDSPWPPTADVAPSSLQDEAVRHTEVKAEIEAKKLALDQTADDDTRRALREQLQLAEARLTELEQQQRRRGVRQVYVYEHPRLLDSALSSCKERLLIISPWIRAQVVDHDFLRKLKEALERGVRVHIGFGIAKDEKPEDLKKADRDAEEKLSKLAKKYPAFTLMRFGDTHAKVLICDFRFVVTGSFNWLSFRGDPDRTFRDEQSVLVELPEHIEGVYRENIKRFEAVKSAHDAK